MYAHAIVFLLQQEKQGDPDKVAADEEREGRRGRVSLPSEAIGVAY